MKFIIIISTILLSVELTSCNRSEEILVTPPRWYFDSLKCEVLLNNSIQSYNDFKNYGLYDCLLCDLRIADIHESPDAYYSIAQTLINTSNDELFERIGKRFESLSSFLQEQFLYYFSRAVLLKQRNAIKEYVEDKGFKKIVDEYIVANKLKLQKNEKENNN